MTLGQKLAQFVSGLQRPPLSLINKTTLAMATLNNTLLSQLTDIKDTNSPTPLDLKEIIKDNTPLSSLYEDNNSHYISVNKVVNFYYNNSINFLHINCRSLKQNFSEIVNLLNACNNNDKVIDVCAVTELWITEDEGKFYNIDNYDLVTKCRTNKRGGGIGFFIRKCYSYNVITDLTLIEDYIECLTVELLFNKTYFTFACIYRPPNSSLPQFLDSMDHLLSSKALNKKNAVHTVLGDFNIDHLKQESHAPTSNFISLMNQHYFMPLILYPTRITDTSQTLIDNIYISNTSFKCKSCIICSDISDHLPVLASLTCDIQTLHDNTTYDHPKKYQKLNHGQLYDKIAQMNWTAFNFECGISSDVNAT